VTTTFTTEMKEDFILGKYRNTTRQGICLDESCMDELSCRWEEIILTWRCTIVQAMMVGTTFQLLETCTIYRTKTWQGGQNSSTMIHWCNTWLLWKNFITELDSSEGESVTLPSCFWVGQGDNIADINIQFLMPITSRKMPNSRSGDGKNNPGARISQIPLNLCRSELLP
jgi:hypothetical protein